MIDYAFLVHELAVSHRVSVGLNFGRPRSKFRKQREDDLKFARDKLRIVKGKKGKLK